MSNIWLISDTHLNHNKDFIWKARGFNSVEEMNDTIIKQWNQLVKYDDIVYHLGDFIMGNLQDGIKLIEQLNGKIRLAIGNHDTDARLEAFKNLHNIDDIQFGYRIKQNKKAFLLTHYPQLVDNYGSGKTYSIHGHTHSSNCFTKEYNTMYNVNCEAHNCSPVKWEDMISEIRKHKK